jgi:hypothetical protein
MINIAMDGGLAGKMTAYISVYVPVRWVEWAVISLFVFKSSRSFAGFLFGGDSTDRLWRLGGIAISCIADIPMILFLGGLPLGRFLC